MEDFFEGFWQELVEALKFIVTPEYGTYDNLNLSESALTKLHYAVIAFYAAIAISAVIVCLNKNIYGSLVIAINGQAAWSAEKAMTLKELGLERNSAVRQGLRGRAYLGLVRCVEQDEYNEQMRLEKKRFEEDAAAEGSKKTVYKKSNYRINFESDRFYIPEKLSIEAESRFERKGSGIFTAFLIIIVTAVCLVLTVRFLPDIIMLYNNFVGIMTESST